MGFIANLQQRKQIQPQGDFDFSLGQTLKNIPGSAGRFVKDISQIFLHPIRTAKSLKDVAQGAINLLIPGEQANEEKARAVGQFFKQRYGSIENIQRTIQEDPVGFLADVSGIVTGGGAALRGVGFVGKLPKIARAGQAIQRVGLAAEPLNLLAKGAFIVTTPIRKPISALARESLGISTGMGGTVIREAFKNPTPEFLQALRGQTTVDNILTTAREGLEILKEQRAVTYTKQLKKIKNVKKEIDISSVFKKIKTKLDEFNIKRLDDGTLDFSRSKIADGTEAQRVVDMLETVENWDDFTPPGLDILKQRFDDFYSPSSKARAIILSVQSELRTTLNKNVKGYEKMTSSYREATNLIKEIEGTLGLKQGARADTTIRKLMSAMKQDSDFKRMLIEEIDKLTKKNISSQLAGAALSPGVPSGLIGRGLFAGILGAPLIGAVSPSILFGLLFSSPRIVGEFLRVLGMGKKAIDSLLEFAQSSVGKEILQVQFQAGRVKEVTEE